MKQALITLVFTCIVTVIAAIIYTQMTAHKASQLGIKSQVSTTK